MAQLAKLTQDDHTIIIPKINELLRTKAFKSENGITAPRIVRRFNDFKEQLQFTGVFNRERMMKCINHIRTSYFGTNAEQAICSGSTGYWMEDDEKEIDVMADSIRGRIEALEGVEKGLRQVASNIRRKKATLPKPDSLGFLENDFI